MCTSSLLSRSRSTGYKTAKNSLQLTKTRKLVNEDRSIDMFSPTLFNSHPAIPPQSPIKYKYPKFFSVTFMT